MGFFPVFRLAVLGCGLVIKALSGKVGRLDDEIKSIKSKVEEQEKKMKELEELVNTFKKSPTRRGNRAGKLKKPCKHGAECKNDKCKYLHPTSADGSSEPPEIAQ